VDDLLEFSSVGLYEFVWLLRGSATVPNEEELQPWSEQALRLLLARGVARLARPEWPDERVVQHASMEDISVDDWADPAQGTYVAVVRP